jgi:hypothetical protein
VETWPVFGFYGEDSEVVNLSVTQRQQLTHHVWGIAGYDDMMFHWDDAFRFFDSTEFETVATVSRRAVSRREQHTF